MPIYSVDTEEEAIELLDLVCPRDYGGQWISPRLAREQTLGNLYAFGDDLRSAHQRMKESDGCS